MKIFPLSLFFVFFIKIQVIAVNTQLLKDYIHFYNKRTIIFLSCDNVSKKVKHIYDFQYENVWMHFWDISSGNVVDYRRLLLRLTLPHSGVINLECGESINVLKELSYRKMFHYEHSWLMFSNDTVNAFEILKNEYINMDAEILVAVPIKEKYNKSFTAKFTRVYLDTVSNIYNIYDVYNPSFLRGGKLNITQTSYWTSNMGWNMIFNQTKIESRRNLLGITFYSVMTIPTLPKNKTFLEHIQSDEFTYLDSMEKNDYRLFQLMMEMYNFTLLPHRALIWSGVTSNGTWKGNIGMLARGEVDVSTSALRWANERYGVFEQTTHTYYVQALFAFLHPKSINAAEIFLSPFHKIVWYLILLLGFAVSFTLSRSFLVEHQRSIGNAMKDLGNEYGYSNSTLMVFGILFQQGYNGNPLLTSSRLMTATILIFSILIFQFYSSFIVGSLLIEPPKTIKTITQLLNSKLQCFIDDVPYIRDNFQHNKEESVIKLYERVMAHPERAFMSVKEGLDVVKRGGSAFHTDGSYAYQILPKILTDSQICSLQDVSYTPKIPGAPGVPNKSPLRELIKISLRKISETGFMTYYWKIWMGKKPKCEDNKVDVVPVDLMHFSSAFYLHAIGMLMSIGLFLCEIIKHQIIKRKHLLRKLRILK